MYLSFRQIFCPTDEAHHTRGILQAGHGLRAAHCSKRGPRHPAITEIKAATSLAGVQDNLVECCFISPELSCCVRCNHTSQRNLAKGPCLDLCPSVCSGNCYQEKVGHSPCARPVQGFEPSFKHQASWSSQGLTSLALSPLQNPGCCCCLSWLLAPPQGSRGQSSAQYTGHHRETDDSTETLCYIKGCAAP